ncbi:biorientation of chromosomes in cell division protein 1-like 1 isoform X2 [Xenia sp. Carnegie-2017]|nr:biorientation of chromosomes in cell division protein 1-like 1 isoform X2 [Xenia sp. Carnegie-2017]
MVEKSTSFYKDIENLVEGHLVNIGHYTRYDKTTKSDGHARSDVVKLSDKEVEDIIQEETNKLLEAQESEKSKTVAHSSGINTPPPGTSGEAIEVETMNENEDDKTTTYSGLLLKIRTPLTSVDNVNVPKNYVVNVAKIEAESTSHLDDQNNLAIKEIKDVTPSSSSSSSHSESVRAPYLSPESVSTADTLPSHDVKLTECISESKLKTSEKNAVDKAWEKSPEVLSISYPQDNNMREISTLKHELMENEDKSKDVGEIPAENVDAYEAIHGTVTDVKEETIEGGSIGSNVEASKTISMKSENSKLNIETNQSEVKADKVIKERKCVESTANEPAKKASQKSSSKSLFLHSATKEKSEQDLFTERCQKKESEKKNIKNSNVDDVTELSDSDFTVSSVHTSDLSSLEDSDMEYEDYQELVMKKNEEKRSRGELKGIADIERINETHIKEDCVGNHSVADEKRGKIAIDTYDKEDTKEEMVRDTRDPGSSSSVNHTHKKRSEGKVKSRSGENETCSKLLLKAARDKLIDESLGKKTSGHSNKKNRIKNEGEDGKERSYNPKGVNTKRRKDRDTKRNENISSSEGTCEVYDLLDKKADASLSIASGEQGSDRDENVTKVLNESLVTMESNNDDSNAETQLENMKMKKRNQSDEVVMAKRKSTIIESDCDAAPIETDELETYPITNASEHKQSISFSESSDDLCHEKRTFNKLAPRSTNESAVFEPIEPDKTAVVCVRETSEESELSRQFSCDATFDDYASDAESNVEDTEVRSFRLGKRRFSRQRSNETEREESSTSSTPSQEQKDAVPQRRSARITSKEKTKGDEENMESTAESLRNSRRSRSSQEKTIEVKGAKLVDDKQRERAEKRSLRLSSDSADSDIKPSKRSKRAVKPTRCYSPSENS